MLPRHQPDPGPELRAVLALVELTHGGHRRQSTDGAHAHQRGGPLHCGVVVRVCGDALVAPGDVRVELAPLALRALQHQLGQGVHLIAGIFEHVGQNGLERCGALGEDPPELGQQAADAVDAGGALCLEAFAQALHAQHALLLDGLHGHEVWTAQPTDGAVHPQSVSLDTMHAPRYYRRACLSRPSSAKTPKRFSRVSA